MSNRRIQSVIQITPIREVFEQKPRLYDWLDLDLTEAKINQQRGVTGDFIYVYDAPVSANVSIRFNEPNNDPIPLKKGMRIQIPFWRFFLTSAALPGGIIRLAVGKDLNFDLTQLGLINVDTISQPVKSQAANTMNVAGSPVNVGAAAPGTLVIAANAGRQSVTVVVEGANPVRFGKVGVVFVGGNGAAGGIKVISGQSYTFYTTEAIYGICDAALNSNVGFEEEYNV
jgi:hypothetical protein